MLSLVKTLCRPRWFVALLVLPSLALALAYLQTITYAEARQALVGAIPVSGVPDYSQLVLKHLNVWVVIGLSICLFGPFLVPFLVQRWTKPSIRARRTKMKRWLWDYVLPSVIVTLAMTAVLQFAFGRAGDFPTVSASGVVVVGLVWATAALLDRWKGGSIEAVGRTCLAIIVNTGRCF